MDSWFFRFVVPDLVVPINITYHLILPFLDLGLFVSMWILRHD